MPSPTGDPAKGLSACDVPVVPHNTPAAMTRNAPERTDWDTRRSYAPRPSRVKPLPARPRLLASALRSDPAASRPLARELPHPPTVSGSRPARRPLLPPGPPAAIGLPAPGADRGPLGVGRDRVAFRFAADAGSPPLPHVLVPGLRPITRRGQECRVRATDGVRSVGVA
ncbi:hypothetical protein Sya03_56920 [Spirilliplanes yamanashiensis]|uniref:Uncharacterized protein n=1 Tax=Spirilliplanes yamanashiensis TaxID=42233 RepID=A0A8J3YEP7_9ACTN|nr:hypothetical protein Sya03_56920 [Spirilliplanes yamanashiensis]